MDWQTTLNMAIRTNLVDPGFQPDPLNTEPIYAQLAAALSEAIRAGRITLGTRLPSERLYARALGLSRTTITAAYQELKATGLLRGYVGRGAVVIADDPDRASSGAIRWSQFGSRLGRTLQPRSVARDRDQISFGDGWLHPSLIPSAALATCGATALRDPEVFSKAAALLGLPALREALVDTLRSNGIHAASGEILITGGAQQGLNAVARALISPGDTVVCESPSWHGAARAFSAAGAEVVGVAMDHEGIDPEALEDSIIRLRPKFVYLIPTFQCPTGRLLGLPRRHRVLDMCARHHTPILESHVYGDISFGDKLPSLKSLDSRGLVIHQGSASKIISAALRVGWLVAPRAAMELLAPAKASLDLSTPALSQAVLAGFLNSGAYARHQPKFRDELRARRDALIGALAAHCPQLRYVVPQGGLYVWAQLPQRIQSDDFEAAAAAEGVSVRGGHCFLIDGGESSHIRLCFAAPSLDQIDEGAQRLGKVLQRMIHGQPETDGGSSTWAPV
jgi:DNA-binding transcriptional MocR family regulator